METIHNPWKALKLSPIKPIGVARFVGGGGGVNHTLSSSNSQVSIGRPLWFSQKYIVLTPSGFTKNQALSIGTLQLNPIIG